jgi:uncharacterized Zn-binding protein involved in type VI secretion
MKILGWIREGDRAACGGVAAEGFPTHISYGKALSYYGARMKCRKNCVIAQAHPLYTLPNGQQVPHHGHVTSGGCPLESTLNDIHGWGNESQEPIALTFKQDENGNCVGATFAEQIGKRFLVTDSETGKPLANRAFIAIVGGIRHEGRTDQEGYAYVDAKGEERIRIQVAFHAPNLPLKHEVA